MTGVHSISVSSNSVGRSQGHAPGSSAQPTSLHKMTLIYTHVLNPGRQGRQEPCGRVVKGRPGVLYRNHIKLSPSSSTAVMRCFHKAYGNFGRGVLYCNFADQGCYRETIYSLVYVLKKTIVILQTSRMGTSNQ
jgi:hypothetical protein